MATENTKEQTRDQGKDQNADRQRGTREDGMPEPTEADLNFGKANPADPSLNNYDIDNQGAPARGDINTTEEQGPAVYPRGRSVDEPAETRETPHIDKPRRDTQRS